MAEIKYNFFVEKFKKECYKRYPDLNKTEKAIFKTVLDALQLFCDSNIDIKKNGITIKMGTQIKLNPAVNGAKMAHSIFLAGLRHLGIKNVKYSKTGRPLGSSPKNDLDNFLD